MTDDRKGCMKRACVRNRICKNWSSGATLNDVKNRDRNFLELLNSATGPFDNPF